MAKNPSKPSKSSKPSAASKAAAPSKRQYDVVLYGATGFVGRQTAAYFANYQGLPQGFQWAVAGRSADKLQAVLNDCGATGAGVLIAEAQDAAAMDALARSARVVLSTAGPFALYGSALVEACVRHGTHYVDITGETPWVRGLIDRHHVQAQSTGAKIIPMCGFDSIPSDLSAFLAQQAMQAQYGEPCASVKTAFSVRGGFNGGTLASVLNLLSKGEAQIAADPFLLNPAGVQPDNVALHTDVVLPRRDADFSAWLGPFFMAPANTRVVRRSAALLGYGDDFSYQEYLRLGRGPVAALASAGVSAGTYFAQIAFKLDAVVALATKLAPPPGSGPSEASMDAGSFRCEWFGKSASGHVVRGVVSDKGDPGNRATTKMVCEAALALALQSDALPGGSAAGGLLTPASGLGQVLVDRLQNAGMTLHVNP